LFFGNGERYPLPSFVAEKNPGVAVSQEDHLAVPKRPIMPRADAGRKPDDPSMTGCQRGEFSMASAAEHLVSGPCPMQPVFHSYLPNTPLLVLFVE
jgi:hypothetical protein